METDGKREKECVCVHVCVRPTYFCVMTKHFFSLFIFIFLSPNFTGSGRTCAAKCTCSAQLCSDFDVDEPHLTCLMVHSSPAASVQCPSEGGCAFFRANKCTSDRGGWNGFGPD